MSSSPSSLHGAAFITSAAGTLRQAASPVTSAHHSVFVCGQPVPRRPTAFIPTRRCPSTSTPPSVAGHTARDAPTMGVGDFLKKAARERTEAWDALKAGRGLDYVKEKAARDLGTVKKFSDGLAKSREALARELTRVLDASALGGGSAGLDTTLSQLEEVLITSDLGVDTVDAVLADLRADAKAARLTARDDITTCLKDSLVRILLRRGGKDGSANLSVRPEGDGPTVIVVIGANGMGKTTTIGKLATRYRREGKTVLLAACDTFRAAAVAQLETWAERADATVVVPKTGQKSAAGVCYDAMAKGVKDGVDIVIVDTSGRLHTNINLMGELKKIVGVVGKFRDGAPPDEVLLVVDASIGRNAVAQARTWSDEIGVSGLVVTKLDGTARAGFVVSVVDELGLPVKLIGVGESVDDLRDFDPVMFVEGLVGS
eukprot:TRINITY_DN461_c0_g1_i4.p1 TRINITY_DN461_c0_g1~~TRINITY_DN461_c0_g1_i4.p1  ORF type:complete len:450 (-),score=146.59 TRINITY_DN461_c0_g1_i4:1274-2563(-)